MEGNADNESNLLSFSSSTSIVKHVGPQLEMLQTSILCNINQVCLDVKKNKDVPKLLLNLSCLTEIENSLC